MPGTEIEMVALERPLDKGGARVAGFNAGYWGHSETDNPWAVGSSEARRWTEGWEEGRELYEEERKKLVPVSDVPPDFTIPTHLAAAPATPRNRLMYAHASLCRDAYALMEQKNMDYGAADDPFRNFRYFGALGILVRASDKLARLRTWLERGEYKVNESTKDTVLDLINYAVLFYAYVEEQGK